MKRFGSVGWHLSRRGFVQSLAVVGGAEALGCRGDPTTPGDDDGVGDDDDTDGTPTGDTGGTTPEPTADTGETTPPGAPVVDLEALPLAAYGVGDWSGFLAAMTGVNSSFVDSTGVVLRRLTDATTPVPDASFGMTYASGGAKISRAFGPDADTYWVIYEAFDAPAVQPLGARLLKVQRGVGVLSDAPFAPPAMNAGRLGYTFSYREGETHILYFVGEDQRLHRFDVEAMAFAPDGAFVGDDASHPDLRMDAYPGWLQSSWDGARIAWVAPYQSATEMHHYDFDADVHTVYDDPPTMRRVNDIRLCRGPLAACAIATDDGTKAFWFVAENRVTAFTDAIPGTQGHCDCGESTLYTVDANQTHVRWDRNTFGDPPDADGGPWAGTTAPMADGVAPDHVIIDGDYHTNMSWDQTGAGDDERFCIDNDVTSPYKNTADGWELDAAAVYRTRVTFGIYGSAAIGVSGVLLWNGSTTAGAFTGQLAPAASIDTMTAGSWLWDGDRLYVRMPDDGAPDGRVRIVNGTLLGEKLGYIRHADGELRMLCHSYRNEGTYTYFKSVFANWSIDGKLCVFNSNLGVQDARTDLLLAEVPVTAR
ncbi:MAG: hypothetical protein ABMB14_09850 [Myxococcota bacterium]